METHEPERVEFGDFQTPFALAEQVVAALAREGAKPRSLIEPTCGVGNFIRAAVTAFPSLRSVLGIEINDAYLTQARSMTGLQSADVAVDLRQEDFFRMDWDAAIARLADPILVLGNPPWVTSAGMSALGGANLPEKSNFQNRSGHDARTGKSNFDITEWMVIRLLEAISRRDAMLALLMKTHVARRCLLYAWSNKLPLRQCTILRIDAKRHFGVSADACLLLCRAGDEVASRECTVRSLVGTASEERTIGFRDGTLVSDPAAYDRRAHFVADPPNALGPRWRSGVKHDCARVLELTRANGGWANGFDEPVDIEDEYVYPLWKGSDVARRGAPPKERALIVPQQSTSDNTARLAEIAPKLWAYLSRYAENLDRRTSSVYRNRSRFCVFGIGSYTFAPWKVAVAGLYKSLQFVIVAPLEGRPVVFDDTVYYLSFDEEADARLAAGLLNSEECQDLLRSLVFWDSKRPVTAELLRRVDLCTLAEQTGLGENTFRRYGEQVRLLF